MTSLIGMEPENQKKPEGGRGNRKGNDTSVFFSVYEWFELFIIAFAIVILVMTCVARHSPVEGESMMDTLHENDILIISDLFYTPKQGDIVVFESTRTTYAKPYVKRVIAVGGQTITVDDDTGRVYVDGEQLNEESYALFKDNMASSTVFYPCTIPEGYVFVMGDNRNHSHDSRYIGLVDERCILGKAVIRLLPFDRFGVLD